MCLCGTLCLLCQKGLNLEFLFQSTEKMGSCFFCTAEGTGTAETKEEEAAVNNLTYSTV